MDFSIRKIMPHVYHLDFGTQFDVAMHFLRFQDYYESPKFYKKFFTLLQHMKWYSQEYGQGAFTYPDDWSGFNVPIWALLDVRHGPVPDPNEYDSFMFCLIDKVLREEEDHPFYFIGTYAGGKKGSLKDTLGHEIAHALYAVNSDYRGQVDILFEAWGCEEGHAGEEIDSAGDVLHEMGYHPSTIQDEIHAYAATGLCKELKGVMSEDEMKPFQKLFKRYQKKCARLK